jgi:predicted esterase
MKAPQQVTDEDDKLSESSQPSSRQIADFANTLSSGPDGSSMVCVQRIENESEETMHRGPFIQLERIVLLLLSMALATENVHAQARDTVASLRTRYNTVKTQAKPQGELKTRLDAIDEQLVRAAQAGRTGQVRRLYAQGIALAGGREWTPELEYATSLVLRSERLFLDPAKPVSLRLEQIYMPSTELAAPLSVRLSAHRPGAGVGAAQLGALIQDFGRTEEVSRDLIDNPLRVDLDLSPVPDGRAILRAEVFERDRSLGAATLAVEVRRGLDQRLSRLESEIRAVKGFDALRAEVLYPVDYIKNVDRGRFTIGQFNVERELEAAEAILATLKTGRDPLAGKTGDFKRHYAFIEAGEIMPYRLYIPTRYTSDRAHPLVVMLHGNGGTENTFMDGNNGLLQQLAEERGYVVVVPLGYRVDGAYGYNNGSRTAEENRKLQLSEKDVLNVLELMKKNYNIDPNRTYLAGHSMGGGGTWYMGQKHSGIWAALGSFAGNATPETIPPIKPNPQFIVHGDADATVSVERSRTMAAALKKLGVQHQYIEVPGGTHGNVVASNFRAMFDFFDKHRKAQSN